MLCQVSSAITAELPLAIFRQLLQCLFGRSCWPAPVPIGDGINFANVAFIQWFHRHLWTDLYHLRKFSTRLYRLAIEQKISGPKLPIFYDFATQWQLWVQTVLKTTEGSLSRPTISWTLVHWRLQIGPPFLPTLRKWCVFFIASEPIGNNYGIPHVIKFPTSSAWQRQPSR